MPVLQSPKNNNEELFVFLITADNNVLVKRLNLFLWVFLSTI